MKIKATYLQKSIVFFAALLISLSSFAFQDDALARISISQLPKEAIVTLQLIRQGGPFPYEKDGSVFKNYEKQLPLQQRGYYREYTVKTPRAKNRGARRIVSGGNPRFSGEYYYTDNHYRSFKRIQE
jgi:ribonuclease T1